jgi:hypothetical protein
MHCSNTLSNETIVCDKLARKIVLTIRQFLSSSGIDGWTSVFSLDYFFRYRNPQAIMDAFANPRNGPWGSGERRVTRLSWEANVDAFGNNAA